MNGEVRIVLRGCPIALLERTRRHTESLMREFAFIAESDREGTSVPARLVALVDRVRGRIPQLGGQVDDQVAVATADGATTIDLEIALPADGRAFALELSRVFDEAEEFCRTGDLLTLAESDEPHRFRSWYLAQYTDQLAGEAPTSWPEWRLARS